MTELRLAAAGKINLTLRVGPRRSDGFHEIESLLVPIDLCDEVVLTLRDDGRLMLVCDAARLPADDRNLALRAARILRAHLAEPGLGAHILLRKRIPAGAGLGGGSADAAAVLRGLCRLWGRALRADVLMRLGASVGSDVPALLFGGPVIARGRGERVQRADGLPEAQAVVMLPPLACRTAEVYAAFDALPPPPARPPAAEILGQAGDAAALLTACYNDLEPAAMRVCPQLGRLRARAEDLLGQPVRLSGSGSALFTLAATREQAVAAAARVGKDIGLRVRVCRLERAAGPAGR